MIRKHTTIIIATWKYPQGCLRLLESISENTKKGDARIIILNDGTPEGYENVKEYGWENGCIYHCHEKNKTVYKNWNFGLKLINLQDTYPVILNDDVVVLPGWLDALWENMDEKTAWVGFQQMFNGQLVSHWIGSCMLINSNMLQECGLFDERFRQNAGDVDLEWRAHYAGYTVKAAGCFMKHEVSRTMRPGVGMGPNEHHRRCAEDNRRLAWKHATRWHELDNKCKREIDWRDFYREMDNNRTEIEKKIFGEGVAV